MKKPTNNLYLWNKNFALKTLIKQQPLSEMFSNTKFEKYNSKNFH